MSQKLPWYQEGLRFECTGCGGCCTGSPGYVWVNEQEIVAIAERLGLSVEDFCSKHIRQVGHLYALREVRRGTDYDCEFLQGKRCTIYDVRPTQCRTYPWWPQNIDSPDAWRRTAVECEGIRAEAPVVPLEKIERDRQEYDASR